MRAEVLTPLAPLLPSSILAFLETTSAVASLSGETRFMAPGSWPEDIAQRRRGRAMRLASSKLDSGAEQTE
jgi:hypothetical protein